MAEQDLSSVDLEPVYGSLREANAAGNTEAVGKLSNFIRQVQSARQSPTTSDKPMHEMEITGADTVAGAVSEAFKTQKPQHVSIPELEGSVGGGAIAGGSMAAIGPKALQYGGKALEKVPNKYVKAVGEGAETLGKSMEKVPLGVRTTGGAVGGAVSGGVESAGKAVGAPPAVTTAGVLIGGGVGETATKYLQAQSGKLIKAAINASYGNVPGVTRAIAGLASPNKEINAAAAVRVQKELFGEKTPGFPDLAIGSDNRIAAQEQLRQADPSLGQQAAQTTKKDRGTLIRDEEAYRKQWVKDNPNATSAELAKLHSRPDIGLPNKTTTAPIDLLKPASDVYRDRITDSVTNAVNTGKPFSKTPEFADFNNKLRSQVEAGNISKNEYDKLMKSLTSDTSKDKGARDMYASTVDNRIRQLWEPDKVTGASAVDYNIAKGVKDDLKKAYSSYVEKVSGKPIYSQYNKAYATEKLAEAKDKLPHFLKGEIKSSDFAQFAGNLARDGTTKPFIQQALGTHLANTPPSEIVGQFEKLRTVLVQAKMLNSEDVSAIRKAVEQVKNVADKGDKDKLLVRLSNMILLRASQSAGATVGAKEMQDRANAPLPKNVTQG